jgi:hypothetical protein
VINGHTRAYVPGSSSRTFAKRVHSGSNEKGKEVGGGVGAGTKRKMEEEEEDVKMAEIEEIEEIEEMVCLFAYVKTLSLTWR